MLGITTDPALEEEKSIPYVQFRTRVEYGNPSTFAHRKSKAQAQYVANWARENGE